MTAPLEDLPGFDEPPAFVFKPWHELALGRGATWLVEGLIPAGGLVWLYGDPGSRKSFTAFDLAVAVAAGVEDWHGHALERHGPARILLGEGHHGAPERIGAAITARELENPESIDVGVLESPPNLLDPVAMRRLATQLIAEPPALIVFDTWNTLAAGADGSHFDTASVATACRALTDLARETGATLLVVDHPNRTVKDAPAGSFAKAAASDAMWSVTLDKDTQETRLRATKMKDAPLPTEELRFRLVPLQPGFDGSPVYLERVDEMVSLGGDTNRGVSLTLKALVEVATDDGVTDAIWKEVSLADGVTRPTYYRAKRQLIAGNLVQRKGSRFVPTPGGLALVSPRLTVVSPDGDTKGRAA